MTSMQKLAYKMARESGMNHAQAMVSAERIVAEYIRKSVA